MLVQAQRQQNVPGQIAIDAVPRTGRVLIKNGNSQAASPAEAAPVATASQKLVIRAIEPTRIALVSDGHPVRSGKLEAREVIEVEGEDRISLEVQDLTHVVLSFNGERIEPLHNLNHPRRLVFMQTH
jgi:hypothetical protein